MSSRRDRYFGDVRDMTATVDLSNLGSIDDSDTVEQYAAETQWMEEQRHDRDIVI